MPLVSSKELLQDAKNNHYAIPAFNVENIEMAQACVEAAEELLSPIILATTESTDRFIPMDLFSGFITPLANNSKIPIALHLDHSKTNELVLKAIKAGYTSVMIDASKKSYSENIALTKEIKYICNIFKIPVESELGVIIGKKSDGEQTVSLTNPETVDDFVNKTNVDSLAISIGNKHGLYTNKSNLDFNRLKDIRKVTDIPLVLHGASGIPDKDIIKCVKLGINKCNFATDLRVSYSNTLKQELNKPETSIDPREYLSIVKNNVKSICIKKIKLLGSEARA